MSAPRHTPYGPNTPVSRTYRSRLDPSESLDHRPGPADAIPPFGSLTKDEEGSMSVVTEVSLPSDSFGLGRVLQEGTDARIELLQFVPTSGSLVPYFWVETDDVTAFETAVRAHDRVDSLTVVDTGPERMLFQIEWAVERDAFLDAIVDHGLLIEEGTGTAESWRFRLRSSDRENLSAFQQTVRDHGISVDIERVWTPSTSSTDQYGLTAKQREALQLAITSGYFDIPRETSLSELGDELGITGQSFSRRLRRGVSTLLSNTILEE